jgi:hypothetical protein
VLGREAVLEGRHEGGHRAGHGLAEAVVEGGGRREEDEPAAVEVEDHGELAVVARDGVGEVEPEVGAEGGVQGHVAGKDRTCC